MRTFKFRGKASHNGEWLFGDLINICGNYHILGKDDMREDGHHVAQDSDRPTWVDLETIGQFTGLTDKNGKEIYEGDIIKIVEKFDDENVYTSNGVVCFEEGIYELQNGKHFAYLGWLMHNGGITKLEVIGNIHDNPELLKGGDNENE